MALDPKSTGPIQRVPLGILQWLGLRNAGDQPRELMTQVRPIVDTTAFYAAQDMTQITQTDAATLTVGQGSFVDVPAGEAWLVLALGGLWSTFTAGSVFRAGLHLGFQPNLVPVYQMEVALTAVATTEARLAFVPPQPLILPPGSRLGTVLLQSMAATAVPQTRVLYVPMRV